MKIVIIALGFLLVPLGALYPGERFGGLGSGRFGLLLATALSTATFIPFEIIETVKSHVEKLRIIN